MTMVLKIELNISTCIMHFTGVTTVGQFSKRVMKIVHPLPKWMLQCISMGIITPCTRVSGG